jgi:hypothetical protein
VIRTLVYVGCDECGDPIGTGDDMADNAREARARAARLGATRVRRNGKLADLCHRCATVTAPYPSGGES